SGVADTLMPIREVLDERRNGGASILTGLAQGNAGLPAYFVLAIFEALDEVWDGLFWHAVDRQDAGCPPARHRVLVLQVRRPGLQCPALVAAFCRATTQYHQK